MKEFIFNENELNLIRNLKKLPPKKVWWGFVDYTFDYENYHIVLTCESETPASINNFDEAIISKIRRIESNYIPGENSVLVIENPIIEDVFIVRTCLYFSTFKTYSKSQKVLKSLKFKFNKLIGKNNPEDILLDGAMGETEEVVCHPESKEVQKINSNNKNLIDIGIIIKIGEKVIKAYLPNNSFGFHIWDEKYLLNKDEIIPDLQFCKAIPIQ